jgi:PKD repeat protein
MKKILFLYLISCVFFGGMNSCKKDTPAPTAQFEFVVDGYIVTFTSTVTDATTYLWDFGDGETSTVANPVHTYLSSGTYSVKLTATGDGGEADVTHDVVTLPSFGEMLTGGPLAENGKTWVLSRGYIEGVDGGSGIEPSMMILFAAAPNILDGLGLATDEYDNEFTFFNDGKYMVDTKDAALAGSLFGLYGGEQQITSITNNTLGLCTTTYTHPENATWTLHEDNLVVTAAPYGGTDVPAITYSVTFTGKKWISLSEGAYFGILDYPATRQFIVKELTPEKMSVAMFICAYWADPAGSGQYPVIMYHLTYVPKSK